jgi:hypothetical protein
VVGAVVVESLLLDDGAAEVELEPAGEVADADERSASSTSIIGLCGSLSSCRPFRCPSIASLISECTRQSLAGTTWRSTAGSTPSHQPFAADFAWQKATSLFRFSAISLIGPPA